MNYYYLSWNDFDDGGIAYAPENILSYSLQQKTINNKQFNFNMILNGQEQDYLGNNLGIPIMSEKLKDVINNNISKNDYVKWIKIKIQSDKLITFYYVPHFLKKIDVLDNEKTLFSGTDFIVKAVLSIEKITGLHFLALPDLPFSSRIIVSETIKAKIEKEGLTGINFELVQSV